MARKEILDRELRRQLREADQLYDSEKDEDSSDNDDGDRGGQRGRKFIQFAWSRVVSINADEDQEIVEHWIRRDQIIQARVRQDNKRLTRVEWKPLFMPDDFAKSTELDDLERFRLNLTQLKRHAGTICKLRKELRQRALKIIVKAQEDCGLDSYTIPKLQRWTACDKYDSKKVYEH